MYAYSVDSQLRTFFVPLGVLLLASSGQKPGMLLNRLECTEQPLRTRNYLVQNVNNAQVYSYKIKDYHNNSNTTSKCHKIKKSQDKKPFYFL